VKGTSISLAIASVDETLISTGGGRDHYKRPIVEDYGIMLPPSTRPALST